MLKITPNRLIVLRIFLLPLPCALLFGGPESKLTAVGLGSLLGFTDYLDGRLARRKGSSRLGTLGLLVLFPKAGAFRPLMLIALETCFLLELLRRYFRSLL